MVGKDLPSMGLLSLEAGMCNMLYSSLVWFLFHSSVFSFVSNAPSAWNSLELSQYTTFLKLVLIFSILLLYHVKHIFFFQVFFLFFLNITAETLQ